MSKNRDFKSHSNSAMLFGFVILTMASTALAQESPQDPMAGTSGAKGLSSALLAELGRNGLSRPGAAISPSKIFANAQYATAGVALRNREFGSLQISGIAPPVKKAFLYFAYLYLDAPPTTQNVKFCSPTAQSPVSFACQPVTTALLATGADPCWTSNGIAIYRGDVTALTPGNGEYQIKLPSTVSLEINGKDPWVSNKFPAAEGASLVVVGKGTGNVAIYDVGFAGDTFPGSVTYQLTIPGGVVNVPVLWDNIGADGQIGASRAVSGIGEKQTFINNVQIGGPGVNASNGVTDSDWDGSSGWPLPQLWDDTGHNSLPLAAATKGTASLGVQVYAPGAYYDCVTTVANVVGY